GERFGNATMRVGEVAQLVLPTGRIVACDPCYLRSSHARELPYTRAVPTGRYPVRLALLSNPPPAASQPNYEPVACASVRLQAVPIERWEMALHAGQNPGTLKPGYYLGYGVDSGTGCFLDEWTANLIPEEQPAYQEAMHRLAKIEDTMKTQRLLVPPAF